MHSHVRAGRGISGFNYEIADLEAGPGWFGQVYIFVCVANRGES